MNFPPTNTIGNLHNGEKAMIIYFYGTVTTPSRKNIIRTVEDARPYFRY